MIDLNTVGYKQALEETINIHLDRKAKYGDSWRERKEYQLMGLVKEKADRLEYNFLNPVVGGYDTKIDCLKDLINWALFYLQIELENKPLTKTYEELSALIEKDTQ